MYDDVKRNNRGDARLFLFCSVMGSHNNNYGRYTEFDDRQFFFVTIRTGGGRGQQGINIGNGIIIIIIYARCYLERTYMYILAGRDSFHHWNYPCPIEFGNRSHSFRESRVSVNWRRLLADD